MNFLICVLMCFGSDPCVPPSYLYQPSFCMDDVLRGQAEPDVPRPGDIFLGTERTWIWRIGHRLALIGPPHHSGIVVARPDGSLGLMEAGPFNDSPEVEILDLLPHLAEYVEIGETVWIRRRRVPLTPEQSARLTEFAMNQEGKRFAMLRILLQLTPFRPRGPVRTKYIGRPWGDNRLGWICSELVTEACVAAGLICKETARPAATSPGDLFYGRSRNPYIDRHLEFNCGWYPPARWLPCPRTAHHPH